jgi:phosphoenolpyruvate phosphomutase
MDKATRLRKLLEGAGPVLAAGAHNGLTARLVEEAGFHAVWASGFEISASHAVPDANILTMSEALGAARDINEACGLPVIADGDNGFGNAINVQRAVQEFEKAGIAALCIEDNEFPKRCSFYTGVKRSLVSLEEHAGKVRAAVRARIDPDFLVIARTEALIVGLGVEEALERAGAYAEAGADAVLVHSKAKDPDEILEFGRRWTGRVPLVAVPTTYKHATAGELAAAGYRIVIYANHGLRAAVRATREALAAVRRAECAAAADPLIVPMEEIYRLVGVSRMQEDEKRYLPRGGFRAVILAAGEDPMGPRCMLPVRGKTILERQVEALREGGAGEIVVVRGFGKDGVRHPGVRLVDNEAYATTGEIGSLACVPPEGRTVVLYGDILFDPALLHKLAGARADATILVDRDLRPGGDWVVDTADFLSEGELVRFTRDRAEARGEYTGIALLSGRGHGALAAMDPALSLPRAFERLAEGGVKVAVVETFKGWMDVDTLEDYERARRFEPRASLPRRVG